MTTYSKNSLKGLTSLRFKNFRSWLDTGENIMLKNMSYSWSQTDNENNLLLIISEYKNKLSQTGQPGIGDAFLKWVLTNQANPNRCQTAKITETGIDSFEEFPQDRESLLLLH